MNSTQPIMPDLCNRRFPFHYATALMLLKSLGVDISRIHLKAVGEYENYKGEIRTQQPEPGTPLTERTEISLEVGFQSAVDYMPYQFFYGIDTRHAHGRKWEDDARCLMAPFDGAVLRWTADAGYETLKFTLSAIEENHIIRLLHQFGFDAKKYVDNTRELIFWTTVLPTYHEWAGNPEKVSIILKYIFDYTFEIVENIPSTHEIPSALRSSLGKSWHRLGSELVLGKSFTDLDSCYEVVVCDVSSQDCVEWLPGKSKRVKLERLLELCMPGNLEYKIRIQVSQQNTTLGYDAAQAYLGVATYIT